MLCRITSGGIVAATLLLPALFVGRPAFADEEESSTPIWSLSAQVTSPTGDVTGHWVTPDGQNSPPVSPGENVSFSAKYNAHVSGGTPNASFVPNISWTLEQGSRSSDGTYTFVSQAPRGSYYPVDPNSNPPHYDQDGSWSLGEQTITKVWFISATPAQATNPPKNVAAANIYSSSVSAENHKDFTVTFPAGQPHP